MPLGRLDLAGEELEEGGLAGTVWADDGDAALAIDAYSRVISADLG